MDNKLWKIYDDKNNIFYTQTFDHVKYLNTFNGYDFIYREINHWEYSNTGCIYEMWDCILKEGDIVVDLGSNVGFFTNRSSELASKVIAIDGSPEAYSCLVENCKDLLNVQTLNASILSENSSQSWLWSFKGNPLRMSLEEMMKIFKIEKIDFLKCDIEGGEYDLFKNLSEETLSKIDRIAIETHDEKQNENFYLPGKIRHTYYWDYNGGSQTMVYSITPK